MGDVDNDDRADLLVLTYSKKIVHAADSDGVYPLDVAGYQIDKIKAAKGIKQLRVVLQEALAEDLSASPAVTYERTTSKPVNDLRGRQARNQTYVDTIPLDRDGDGLGKSSDDCLKRAEDPDGFEDSDGCPDRDNDGDGLLDVDDPAPDDACLPVTSGDGCDPDEDNISNDLDDCDGQAEDGDGFEDADGCPDPDNDGDGLLDGDDPDPDDGCVPDDSGDSCDSDIDGIANALDQCDGEAEDDDGFEDADGCPDPDNDGDGLQDGVDECPDAAEDDDGFEDSNGCPDPDNDGDGVLDGDDAEPDNPCVPDDQGADCDPDGDGVTANQGDCGPSDPLIKPSASDEPDLAFVDSNCDGVDGTRSSAVFVSPLGDDTNSGVPTAPVKTLAKALEVAANADPDKDVYVATGLYEETLEVVTGIAIYGGYDPADWSRSSEQPTVIRGSPAGAVANGDTDVLLQLLTLEGRAASSPGSSSYGVRAINGSDLTLQKTTVVGGDASDGAAGSTAGSTPPPGSGFAGGGGGLGGYGTGGGLGSAGSGPLAGSPGAAGAYNANGGSGGPGGPGSDGAGGAGGQVQLAGAGTTWDPSSGNGQPGSMGTAGSGGGGGGGGGGFIYAYTYSYSCNCSFFSGCRTCFATEYYYYYGGNGGTGGSGGGPGSGGSGGGAGGSAFGLYLHDSVVTVLDCEISAGNGGDGGAGRAGGAGGSATGGAPGIATTYGDGGPGGVGGRGGHGGGGGGGAGGSSIAVFLAGTTSQYNGDDETELIPGSAGQGGPGGSSPGQPGANGGAGLSLPKYPTP